ncbi:hypothetical protein [Ktedonospora formicarum]|uniref:hypothetical protein n=1 Tax=Ktedonospora formicarum TaxID=2778364 RepID=UPI001C689DD3|nr:hypothetical protein [Ktedonospora formicarum]
MHKSSMKVLIISFFVSILFISFFSESALAHTHANKTASNSSQNKCAHLLVHLNGSKPATFTCLDHTLNGVIPNTSVTGNCGSAQVILYDDYSDVWAPAHSVCFTGKGFINLTDIPGDCSNILYSTCGQSWNDRATEYKLQGCATNGGSSTDGNYPGYFASDTQGNGFRQYFKNSQKVYWFGHSGEVGVQALSSLNIDC